MDKTFDISIFDFDETVSNIIRENSIYSKNDLIVMQNNINDGDIFLDIGANIGWHTLFGSKFVGEKGKVYSFEPSTKNYNLLVENIQNNNLKNVFPCKVALSDFTGTKELALSSVNYGDNIVCETEKLEEQMNEWYEKNNPNTTDFKSKTRESIDSFKLDDFIEQNNIDIDKITFLKMDIQGSEAKALEGMKNLIDKQRPFIIMEYSPKHLKVCKSSPFDILSFIDRNEYVLYHLREQYDILPENILYGANIEEIIKATKEMILNNNYNGFDLFLVPKEKYENCRRY